MEALGVPSLNEFDEFVMRKFASELANLILSKEVKLNLCSGQTYRLFSEHQFMN
jgi:hypothetical protein